MALESYARNLYAHVQAGDVSLVLVKLTSVAANATGLDPDSAPNVSITSASGGVYVLSVPQGQEVFVLAVTGVNTATKTISAIAADAAAGTFGFTISGGSNLATTEQVHVCLALSRN